MPVNTQDMPQKGAISFHPEASNRLASTMTGPGPTKLWREWAAENGAPTSATSAIGSCVAESKKAKFKRMEAKCAELAAQAQKRIMSSSGMLSGGLRSRHTSSATRQQASSSEAAAETWGYSSRGSLSMSPQGGHLPPASPSQVAGLTRLHSMASYSGRRPATASSQASLAGGLSQDNSRPLSPRREHSSASLRPASASAYLAASPSVRNRTASASPMFRRTDSLSAVQLAPRGTGDDVYDSSVVYNSMQVEANDIRAQLDEARSSIESQTELEGQLRDTVKMLQARLHAQGLREVDNERRLVQHSSLEPLFDQMAERFAYGSAQEVMDKMDFLETDKLGSFDLLLRTQEDVAELQSHLRAATQRVEDMRVSLTEEHDRSVATLQRQNEQLVLELHNLETLNQKLTERQDRLAVLQKTVVELWEQFQQDPKFVKSTQGLLAGHTGGDAKKGNEPETLLCTFGTFISSSTPVSAKTDHHYTEVQKVANLVWHEHFRHKARLRGSVVETFEQLSRLADIMAGKLRALDEDLEKTKENEKKLTATLTRVNVQRRALKSEVGVKERSIHSRQTRRERPGSAMLPTRSSASFQPGNQILSAAIPGQVSESDPVSNSASDCLTARLAGGPVTASAAMLGKVPHARPQSATFSYIRPAPTWPQTIVSPKPSGMLLVVNVEERRSGEGSTERQYGGLQAENGTTHGAVQSSASPTGGPGALYTASKLVSSASMSSNLAPSVYGDASLATVPAAVPETVPQLRSPMDAAFFARLQRSAIL